MLSKISLALAVVSAAKLGHRHRHHHHHPHHHHSLAQHSSIPACNSIECKTETAAHEKLQKDMDKHDKDYFVPNFGVDRDILWTHGSDAQAKAYCAGKGARCGQPWVVAA